ncbi:MAG: hypothetical protein IPJ13_31365 [Saprospiraceae bacterium]|nr:hypothetical protein [Saprospiraceae bacterium]
MTFKNRLGLTASVSATTKNNNVFFPLNFERLAATLSRGILTDPFGCPDANSPEYVHQLKMVFWRSLLINLPKVPD